MTPVFWPEFWILFIASLLGGLAIIPYSLRLLTAASQKKPLKMSVPKIMLLSFLQTTVLFAIVVGVGLFVAHAIRLGAPYIETVLTGTPVNPGIMTILQIGIVLGVLAGMVLLLADLLFMPYWPEVLLDTARKTTLSENFLASFYGGINEELLMRLFGFSVLAWLLSRMWHTPTGLPTSAVFWIVNVIMAVVFGLGHLPALKGMLGKITPVMFTRTMLLNAPVGLICGWLFWKYGIEAAIIAHFAADIIYHVGGTVVLRLRTAARAKMGKQRAA
jgi:hypothetical protein